MKLFIKLKSLFTKPNKYKFDIKSADKVSKFTLVTPYKISPSDVKYTAYFLKDLDSMYNSVIDSKTIDRFKNIVNHKISDKGRDVVRESFENETPLNVEKVLSNGSIKMFKSPMDESQEEMNKDISYDDWEAIYKRDIKKSFENQLK